MRRGARGFTILELLIALAIVGALLVIAFGGLRVALAAWRQGEERAEAHQHARGVALALARTVGAAYPFRGSRGEAPETVLLFAGSETKLELVTQAAPVPFAVPIAFTAVVITLGEGEERPGLVIRQRALPNRNPFADAAVVFHDPAVTSLAFQFLDESGSWQSEWTDDDGTLPRAVRIALGTTINGRKETPPPITVSLRLSLQ